MSLSFHIDFNGQCKEAFTFYAEKLGGTIDSMLVAEATDPIRGTIAGRVVHASLCIDGVRIAGADVEAHRYRPPGGFHVLLGVDSEERVRSVFDSLRASGRVVLAPQPTFWSPCYAIVVDRFGVPWKINGGVSA